ncbi:MAG: hypothetical protein EOO29_26840 [Comamonadaceae bacterium]|nr:MAG: hypothetical protein EOO29_26840 [Comamonadaceae bacterium]
MNQPQRKAGLTAIKPNPVSAHTLKSRLDERLQIATSDGPVRNSTMRAPYTGAELSSSNNRLGSRDALRLPSRTFYGTRTPEASEV